MIPCYLPILFYVTFQEGGNWHACKSRNGYTVDDLARDLDEHTDLRRLIPEAEAQAKAEGDPMLTLYPENHVRLTAHVDGGPFCTPFFAHSVKLPSGHEWDAVNGWRTDRPTPHKPNPRKFGPFDERLDPPPGPDEFQWQPLAEGTDRFPFFVRPRRDALDPPGTDILGEARRMWAEVQKDYADNVTEAEKEEFLKRHRENMRQHGQK